MTTSSPAPGRRRFAVARWSALSVLVVVAVLVAVLATRPSSSEQLADSPLVGKRAPGLAGPELAGSRRVSLASYKGRWVLVNFFASWCTVCVEEAPELERFSETRPDGLRPAVLSVLYGDTRADGIRFERAEGATWPAVYDRSGAIAEAWGVGSLPRSYLVSPGGRVIACILGGITSSQLDTLVERRSGKGGVPT